MAEEVKIKVTADTKQADSALSQLNKSWVGLNAGISLAKQAAQALGEAYKFLAGDTMEYAAQVRQMMRVSGQNAEMTSRMIQLTDDFALSEGSLEAAMKGAAQKGIAFTVDSLAELSDEYLALEDPIARNTFLVETFGRAGLEMAKVMERGSEAIKKQGEAQADNLIMTQANLDAAEELRIAEDNLNDSFQGIKYTLGNAVIPELVKAANAFELLITWHDKLKTAIKQNSQAMVDAELPYKEYLDQMTQNVTSMGYVVKSTAEGVRIYRQVGPILKEVENTFGILSRSEYAAKGATQGLNTEMRFISTYGPGAWGELQNLAGAADDAAGAIEGTNAKMDTLRRQAADTAQAYDDMNTAQGNLEEATKSFGEQVGGDLKSQFEQAGIKGGELDELLGIIDDTMGTAYKPAKELEDMTAKLVDDYLRGGRDGDAFKQSLENLKGPMEQLYDPLTKAREELDKILYDLEQIHGDWSATLYFKSVVGVDISGGTSGGGGGGGSAPTWVDDDNFAMGGAYTVPEGFYENYPVGMGKYASSGEVVTITPKNEGAGMTINNLYVTLPGVTNARQFADALGTLANNARNSGRAFQGG